MARVVLEHIGKIYPNGFEAIRDLDLDVADGQLTALVGPSGCGKTTTLRMIAGLEHLTRGKITIGGRVVNHLPPRDRDVAMVFQNHVLYPHMTVYGNMAFALKLRKVPGAETDRKVRRAASMLGIEHLLDWKPRQLSGGQRQRVALGRAVVRQPACFLLDEPLSNLDARLRLQMQAELKRLHRRLQTTTIYVTHDQEEAMALGDRIAVITEGRLQQIGTPEEVYRHPANRFVAGFIGAAPMNFLEGMIVQRDGRLWFDEGSRQLALPDWAASDLAGKVGAKVILGIRPETVKQEPIEGQSHNALNVRPSAVESRGDTTDVHLSTDQHPDVVARFDSRARFDPAALRQVYVDLNRVHFFDPDDETTGRSGENLCLAAEKRSCQETM